MLSAVAQSVPRAAPQAPASTPQSPQLNQPPIPGQPQVRVDAALDGRSVQAVKADFLIRFIEYVEWPAPQMPEATAPWVIAVDESEESRPVYDALVRAASGMTVRGRPVLIHLMKGGVTAKTVHVQYFGTRTEGPVCAASSGVLTVSDEVLGAVGAPCIIQFIPVDGRIKFDVVLGVAERAGLKLSSRMLQVANRVIGVRG